ncbi:MAG: adenine phosphoribosyltransferase [Candidatus Woesearchaeota archaeon]
MKMEVDLKRFIREIPDFPKKGILFYDITTLIKEGNAYNICIENLYNLVKNKKYDKVAAIESRGFIFAAPLAIKLGCGLAIIRKPGKLPSEVISESYELEYGKGVLEIHKDAILPNEKVLLVDDLLATGGTMLAATKLIEKLGGEVRDILFVIELEFLKGREKLIKYNINSLVKY